VTYILPIGGLYGTYHLLREPETTIEKIAGNRWVTGDIILLIGVIALLIGVIYIYF